MKPSDNTRWGSAIGELQLAQTFPPDPFKSSSCNREVALQRPQQKWLESNLLHGEMAHVHALTSL